MKKNRLQTGRSTIFFMQARIRNKYLSFFAAAASATGVAFAAAFIIRTSRAYRCPNRNTDIQMHVLVNACI